MKVHSLLKVNCSVTLELKWKTSSRNGNSSLETLLSSTNFIVALTTFLNFPSPSIEAELSMAMIKACSFDSHEFFLTLCLTLYS